MLTWLQASLLSFDLMGLNPCRQPGLHLSVSVSFGQLHQPLWDSLAEHLFPTVTLVPEASQLPEVKLSLPPK